MTALWALVTGLFSGWTKWLWIGGAVAVLVGGLWLRYEQVIAQRDLARSEMARLVDANAVNLRTIEILKAEKAKAEAAIVADSDRQQAVTQTVVKWKERIIHVPQSCPVSDRDRLVLDGVRDILNSGRDR